MVLYLALVYFCFHVVTARGNCGAIKWLVTGQDFYGGGVTLSLSMIEAVRLDDVQLVDDPINADWIISGTPVARAAQWSASKDGTTTTHVWDCTKGRFRWYFASDEIVHIIEGSVTVQADGIDKRTLQAGDAALFRAGSWAEWHVEDYVRKHAILSAPLHPSLSFGVRALRKVRRTLLRR